MRKAGPSGRQGGEVVSLQALRERRSGGIVCDSPPEPFGKLLAGDSMSPAGKHADYLVHECLFSVKKESREAALGELVSRKDWRSLVRCMGASDQDIYRRALDAVCGMGLGDELLAFRELQGNPNVKHYAMVALEAQSERYLSECRGGPLLVLAEGSERREIRMAALGHFLQRKSTAVLETLARTSPFGDVKAACLRALEPEFKRYSREGNLGMLTSFASIHESAKVRADAIRALYSAGAASNLQVIAVKSVHEEDREQARRLAQKLSA